MKIPFTLSLLGMLFAFSLSAQAPDYTVLFHDGPQVFPENIETYLREGVISENDEINGQCFFFLQFYQTPNAEQRAELKREGIDLLQYIPNHTYIASVSASIDPARLQAAGVRSLVPVNPDQKLVGNLYHGVISPWTRTQKDQIEVMITFYESLDYETVVNYLETDGFKVVSGNGISSIVRVGLAETALPELAALPYVSTVEEVPPPGAPEDIPGRSLHRACAIDTDYPTGRSYTGEGVGVLVRDDGFVGPHIDFQGRITQSVFYDSPGAHAEGVAGIFAGAGNMDPANRGMAAGSDVFVLNYNADFTDNTMSLHINQGVLVTNSSYSNGCNAGYTSITRTVDQQCFDYPTLMHVFSAGNSNNQNCGYGAGNQWGNITGGHKQGKNVIATANLFADASLVNSSSRGPAHDGRIKPDISANGQNQISTDPFHQYAPFGGTSGASPGIAGITAQLHQAYRDLNGGDTAPGALLKAILMNTANDLGNVGPDFRFGWGHVNAFRAALALEENRYFSATIDQGATNEHTIDIPANVASMKIMTYWADPEASPFSSKALINDLDTRILDLDGAEHLPWVLNSAPDPSTLNDPATKGVDHLNNVEQVEILNPAAGSYTLEVTGFDVPQGPAEYFVVIEYQTDEVNLTYPVGGEGMKPGEIQRFHWDAIGEDEPFTVEYSLDGGDSWNSIGTIDAENRMVEWLVPNQPTGKGHIRITRGASTSLNEVPFSILDIPTNLEIVQACPDYIRLAWSEVSGAQGYDVFLLGDRYMDSIGTTTELFYDIPTTDPTERHWVSVRAKGNDGRRGRRANAILYNDGLKDCDLDNDLDLVALTEPPFTYYTGCDPYQGPISVELFNNGADPVTNPSVSLQVNNGAVITETVNTTIAPGTSYIYTFNEELAITTTGDFPFDVWLHDNLDEASFNDSISLQMNAFIQGGNGLSTIFENFENANGPYLLDNPDGNMTWKRYDVDPGPNGNETTVIMMENFFYPANTEPDAMAFFPVNLTDAGPNTGLAFDYAYAPDFNGEEDRLRIDVFTECGTNYLGSPFNKAGAELGTTFPSDEPYYPSSQNQWRREGFPLEDYAGQSIVVRFVSISEGGNNLFVDNINIQEFAPVAASFTSSKLEACANTSVLFLDNSTGDNLVYQWNFGEGAFPSTADDDGPHIVTYSTPGTKIAQLVVTNPISVDTLQVEIEVYDDPVAGFSTDIINGIASFADNSEFGQEYLWDFGDGNTSTEASPTHFYQESGTYTVELTVTNPCGSNTISQEISVVVSSVKDPGNDLSLQVAPNPNTGYFWLSSQQAPSSDQAVQLFDLSGKVVWLGNWAQGQTRKEVQVSNLPAGIYYLQVVTPEGPITRKVVIE
jgi:PKD repeat protein